MDLLEELGVTIDLKRSVARFGVAPPSAGEASLIADMEQAMHFCAEAFNSADTDRLASCFDPDFILSSPSGELRGRDQATNHFEETSAPPARSACPARPSFYEWKDQRAVGDVVWSLYDYTIESPSVHSTARGMMLCRKFENHWYILRFPRVTNRIRLKP